MLQLLCEAADAAEVAICATSLHIPYIPFTFLGLERLSWEDKLDY